MVDTQSNEPISLPLVHSAEAHPQHGNVLVTLKALSPERLVTILVPLTPEAAEQLVGQLTASAIQARRNRRRGL
jgi:hypothetical protein